jgi:hypothetical protein
MNEPEEVDNPLDWAGDWHLPGLGDIIREDIARSLAYIEENPPAWRTRDDRPA